MEDDSYKTALPWRVAVVGRLLVYTCSHYFFYIAQTNDTTPTPRFALCLCFTNSLNNRPNVGKSTLFNRLVGKRMAIVDRTPGVTRDRKDGVAELFDLKFVVTDTAGLEETHSFGLMTREQLRAISRNTDQTSMMTHHHMPLTVDLQKVFVGWAGLVGWLVGWLVVGWLVVGWLGWLVG